MMLVLVALGSYAVWLVATPPKEIDYGNYIAPSFESGIVKGAQFYPRMRFPEKDITYFIESKCSLEKEKEIQAAFRIISQKTVLSFSFSEINPRIRFTCSEIAPEPEQEDHFVAGEGGPIEIINTSNYFVILESKVSLYREDKCETPQIALHEILHALGFDHTNSKSSIMYPVTNCNQEFDSFIYEDINQLYKVDAAPDLALEAISAKQVGRYLNFQANVTNMGLVDVQDANLEVYAGGESVKNYSLQKIEIGTKKILSVYNLRVSSDTRELRFKVAPVNPEYDFRLENNEAVISLPEEKGKR